MQTMNGTDEFASKKIKGGGAPVGATVSEPHQRVRRAPQMAWLPKPSAFGRARLSALHRGFGLRFSGLKRFDSGPGFLGLGPSGFHALFPVPVQRKHPARRS